MAYCSECGKKLPEPAVFCPNCGHKTPKKQTGSKIKKQSLSSVNDTDSAEVENSGDKAVSSIYPEMYYNTNSKTNRKSSVKTSNKSSVIIGCTVLFLLIVVTIIATPSIGVEHLGYWESTGVNIGGGQIYRNLFGQDVHGLIAIQINHNHKIELYSAYQDDILTGSWEETENGLNTVIGDEVMKFIYSDDDDTLCLLSNSAYCIILRRADGSIEDFKKGSNENRRGFEKIAGSGEVGNGKYQVSVIGAEEFSDIDGKDAIRIYYNFTNNSGQSVSARTALEFHAEQDSEPLKETLAWNDVGVSGNVKLVVRPGVTIQCCCEFIYVKDSGRVDIIFYDKELGAKSDTVVASYLPRELPGAPAGYLPETIDNPRWTLSLPADGSIDGAYQVAVAKAEHVKNSFKEPSIRIYCKFINNSDGKISLSKAANALTFQDGISLVSSDSKVFKGSDENFYQ